MKHKTPMVVTNYRNRERRNYKFRQALEHRFRNNYPRLYYVGQENQLKKVTNFGTPNYVYCSQHFQDGANLDIEYEFDQNGNMLKDYNKGIIGIEYNYLNLPQRLQFQAGHTIKYVYDAIGRKLKVVTQTAIPDVNIPAGTITALENSQIADTQEENYVNNVIYKNGVLYAVRTPEGYVRPINGSDNWEYKYQIKDYLGSVRCEVSQTGNLLGKTNYYPFGVEYENNALPLQEKERFGGKELEAEHGLNLLDFLARKYDPAIPRFTTMDPLAEKYYAISPYAYCANNPVRYIDPTGLAPIYDPYGNLMGTDDNGLRGDAIFMNNDNFKQGMSYDDAMKHNLGMEGLVDKDAVDRYTKSFESLSSRPDWDGYLTLEEANDWYKNGNGQPLFAALNKIDLSGIVSLGEKYVGQVKTFNLIFGSGSVNDGLVYGQITLKRYSDHTVRAFSDRYDFEMHSWWNPLNWGRNIETAIGKGVAGQGTGYEINIYGSKKLIPILPWIK